MLFNQFRESLAERDPWRPVSRPAIIGWIVFFALFLVHAATDDDGFLLLDHVNLITHEAGHFFFSWFGFVLNILGGTLMELLVPLLLGIHFWWRRETTGVAFCSFWFFENFPYIGRYMADARSLALPLVGAGDHDWEILFERWGLLIHDRTIGWSDEFHRLARHAGHCRMAHLDVAAHSRDFVTPASSQPHFVSLFRPAHQNFRSLVILLCSL